MLGCLTIDRRRVVARSRGFTLIELLVVVFIVLAVSALSVAMVVPSLEQRQVREASLSVTSYLNGVRAEAVRTGRPVGVWIERAEGVLGESYATRMYRCTVPPAYTGVTLNTTLTASVATATDVPSGSLTRTLNIVATSDGSWLDPDEDGNKNPLSPVGPGDTIKLGYQGHTYRLDFDQTDGVWYIGQALDDVWVMNSDTATQPYVGTTAIPYQVYRQPRMGTFAISAGMPLVLPPGVVIDLNFSGDDTHVFHVKENASHRDSVIGQDPYIGDSATSFLGGFPNGDRNPIVLMFGKSGALEKIYHTEGRDSNDEEKEVYVRLVWSDGERPTGPIYLLLGRIEKAQPNLTIAALSEVALEDASDEADVRRMQAEQVERFNLYDLNNLWITIHPRTGAVTSSEMAVADPWQEVNPPPEDFQMQQRVNQARAFARSSRGQGGG